MCFSLESDDQFKDMQTADRWMARVTAALGRETRIAYTPATGSSNVPRGRR
jgi:hypothetical protein